jgi:flagellar biosynthesis protein FliR
VLAQWGVGRVAHAFALAFVLAAPFVIGSCIYNLALGAINRAMPQLMVAFIGSPAITWGGLVLLMLAAPVMITVWLGAFQTYLTDPVTVRGP